MEIERVSFEGREIILIGTAHISQKSAELVEKTILEENPDVVGVELDRERLLQLREEKKWQETDILNIVKSGKTYLFLLNTMLASMQRRLGEGAGAKPGMEMLRAVQIAESSGKKIVLLDRDVKITLKRAMNEMSLIEKLKMFYAVVSAMFYGGEEITQEKIEELKQKDMMNELMKELSKQMPSVKKVLVDERDLYIANSILSTQGNKIVAVIGAGHVEGVKKYLDVKRDVSELNKVVEKKSVLRFIGYAVPILFFVILAAGFYFRGVEAVFSMFLFWTLICGGLAALGALIAGAHPFSIIVSFIAAPITTLHPALAVGWFAGLMEAKMRPPRVMDFESLSSMKSFGDFNKNRAMHIILVTAYANIGATIGVIIALPYVLSLIG